MSHPTGSLPLYFNILFLEHIQPLVCVYWHVVELQVDVIAIEISEPFGMYIKSFSTFLFFVHFIWNVSYYIIRAKLY